MHRSLPGFPRNGETRLPLRRAQLSDEVAGHLRAAIMSGALRPGTFIRLDETAAELGVSITPVREALLKLRGEGMVQLEPHRGHVVLPLTRQTSRTSSGCRRPSPRSSQPRRPSTSPTPRSTSSSANDALAAAVAAADPETIAATEFAFHRAFNHATGRIKLAWFLLHVAGYMPG